MGKYLLKFRHADPGAIKGRLLDFILDFISRAALNSKLENLDRHSVKIDSKFRHSRPLTTAILHSITDLANPNSSPFENLRAKPHLQEFQLSSRSPSLANSTLALKSTNLQSPYYLQPLSIIISLPNVSAKTKITTRENKFMH